MIPKDVEVSKRKGFNLPLWVATKEVRLYPTTYEFIGQGEVVYHAETPPDFQIRVPGARNSLYERAKIMQVTLTQAKLDDLGTYSERRRSPSQNKVMGESATEHAQRLADAGKLIYDEEIVSWQWNHLLAFSMLPTERAQSKRNLLCGTAAANGQMANIEVAARAWVEENQLPLGIEVTCTYLMETHLGLRLRYRLHDKRGSRMSHSEYFDLLTVQFPEYGDLDATYDRMCRTFAA